MADLKWKELFKALFLAGFLGYLTIAVFGRLWVGFLAFAGFGWLFYGFGHKIAAARWIFSREFRREFGDFMKKVASFLRLIKVFYWDQNEAKITTLFVLCATPIVLQLLPLASELSPIRQFFCYLFEFLVGITFATGFALLGNKELVTGSELTDKKILRVIENVPVWFIVSVVYRLPKFLILKLPRILIKTVILTIRAVHSRELVACALYALGGMVYTVLFPPFVLPPAQVFLLALGCGLFTGAAGLGAHKVLLTTSAQSVFEWAESL